MVVPKRGAGPACRDPSASCFLHATPYNKARCSAPTGDGASAARCSLSGWAAAAAAAAERKKEVRKAPGGSISKQRYRVPVAIRSGAHAKFSALVCGPRREAEAGGERLRFKPAEAAVPSLIQKESDRGSDLRAFFSFF